MAIIIDESRCTGCGVCVALCKPGALMLDQRNAPYGPKELGGPKGSGDAKDSGDAKGSGSKAVWSAGNCVHCGLCEFYCPEQAMNMTISEDSRTRK